MTRIWTILLLLPSLSLAQMNAEGSAQGNCDCWTLTDATNQTAAIWSPSTIDLNNPFDFTFEVNLGCVDGFGADGMMFVLQQNGTGTGDIGNGMGYADYVGNPNPISTSSVGIEIDTWDSNPAVPTDITSDHIGMSSGGNNDHDVIAPIAIPNIEDCAPHTFQVTWDPVGQNLTVTLDGTPIFTYNGDLITNFFGGNPNVYWGWTGSTGGAMNVQSVCMYRNADFTPDQTTVCANQTITFTDNSTSELNDITNWDWDFGDGNTSTQQNPTHAYGSSGTYTVELTITDISGCTAVHTVDITVNPGLNINMTSNDISCFGLTDGDATATPTNGTAPYNYLWDDPGTQTNQTATGLGPNTYNVDVTDANGCAGAASITINEPPMLVLDSAVTIDASCGVNNGEITFYPDGGTLPYQYSIDGGTSFQGNANFTGLGAGNYNLELQDDNGCSVAATVNVNSNSALVLDSLVATDENCGLSDGTITAYVSAGATPYQYSIDGGTTYQAGNLFVGLAANTYTVQVEDANNCIVTGNVTINSPTTLNIDLITATDPSCFGGSDGQIDVTSSGGTPPYQYSIDGGTTFQMGTNFSGLTSGAYTITVEDASGCQVTANTTLNDPPQVSIDNVIITAISCTGSTDGQIEIIASGGQAPLGFSLDGGTSFQAGNTFGGLGANTYFIQVNDANNCPSTTTAIINEPLPLIIDSIVVQDVTCNGLSDGGITVYANQGTPAYQYSIDGGTSYQAANNFTGLSAGTVNVTMLDANGCSTNGSALISESQPLVASVPADTTICNGGTADICPTVSGGTPPLTYTYNGVNGGNCLATGTAGVYNIQITDANNCTSNIVSHEVFQFPDISIITSPDTIICPGEQVDLFAEASGGDGGPYTFTWVNQNTFDTLVGVNQTVTVDQATPFGLIVTDGCETPPAIATVNVATHLIPVIDIQADTTDGCEPLEVTFTNNTDPSLLSSASWDLGNGDTYAGMNDTVSTIYETPDCYDVFVQIATVDGCVADTTYDDLICVYVVPEANFFYEPDSADIIEPFVSFTNTSQNATTYDWSFGDGNNSTDIHPEHEYPAAGATTYQVDLIASTDYGCADTASQFLTIKEVVMFYAPNTVTPNGDAMNQTFIPQFIPGFDPLGYTLRIFNRWGELMFETTDVNEAWDCTYEGQIVQEGVYVWQITFRETLTDFVYREFGHLTVLK